MASKSNIEHEWKVPKDQIYAFFKELNETTLSFGVHKEDDGKHSKRDREQRKPLHQALYKDTTPIGNAELLAQTENGFTTTIRNESGRAFSVGVPPRPILQPMFESVLQENYYRSIKKAFSQVSTAPLQEKFKQESRLLTKLKIKKYIAEQGWENAPETAVVKEKEWRERLPFLGEREMLDFIYNTQANYTKSVLEDSGDLLNSIKAKVK